MISIETNERAEARDSIENDERAASLDGIVVVDRVEVCDSAVAGERAVDLDKAPMTGSEPPTRISGNESEPCRAIASRNQSESAKMEGIGDPERVVKEDSAVQMGASRDVR